VPSPLPYPGVATRVRLDAPMGLFPQDGVSGRLRSCTRKGCGLDACTRRWQSLRLTRWGEALINESGSSLHLRVGDSSESSQSVPPSLSPGVRLQSGCFRRKTLAPRCWRGV
jgi:hypothetical protein